MKEKLEKELKELKEECKSIREQLKKDFNVDTFEFLSEMQLHGYEYKVNNVRFLQCYPKDERQKENKICFVTTFEDDETIFSYIATK
jgi:hypothetical protein